MTRRTTPPPRGGIITSEFLGRLSDNQNDLLEQVKLPRDRTGALDTDELQQNPGNSQTPEIEEIPEERLWADAEAWSETSRTTSVVRIESDSDSEVFVDVERIDSITFSRAGGGRITLTLDN